MQPGNAKRVLLTGATGCVGRYLLNELLTETAHEVVIVAREPARLPDLRAASDRVKVVQADVANVAAYKGRLGPIDSAILVAASWGGPETEAVNLTANLALTDHLAANGGSRVYYFATSSVLDHEHRLLKAAHELGSPYVRSKYRLVEEIEKRAGAIDVVGLFPTIVVGGGADGLPRSHFANLMYQMKPYFRLACSLSAEGKLHHAHGRDIASVARLLLDSERADAGRGARVVIGNPAVTVDQMIDGLRAFFGYRFLPRVKLRDGLAEFFIKAFRIQLSAWDRYCMEHRDMSLRDPTSPATFGMPVFAPDIGTQLAAIGIKP
jgi:nucleoside-diphosphate-sugar epimerase